MWYCGWDGGGTKTEVCIIDKTGKILDERTFGPLNPNGADRWPESLWGNDHRCGRNKQPRNGNGASECPAGSRMEREVLYDERP